MCADFQTNHLHRHQWAAASGSSVSMTDYRSGSTVASPRQHQEAITASEYHYREPPDVKMWIPNNSASRKRMPRKRHFIARRTSSVKQPASDALRTNIYHGTL